MRIYDVYIILLLLYIHYVRYSTPFRAVRGFINGFRRLSWVRWVSGVTFDTYTKQNMYSHYWLTVRCFRRCLPKGILHDVNIIRRDMPIGVCVYVWWYKWLNRNRRTHEV